LTNILKVFCKRYRAESARRRIMRRRRRMRRRRMKRGLGHVSQNKTKKKKDRGCGVEV